MRDPGQVLERWPAESLRSPVPVQVSHQPATAITCSPATARQLPCGWGCTHPLRLARCVRQADGLTHGLHPDVGSHQKETATARFASRSEVSDTRRKPVNRQSTMIKARPSMSEPSAYPIRAMELAAMPATRPRPGLHADRRVQVRALVWREHQDRWLRAHVTERRAARRHAGQVNPKMTVPASWGRRARQQHPRPRRAGAVPAS